VLFCWESWRHICGQTSDNDRGWVFNFRSVCNRATNSQRSIAKQPNLELKTWQQQQSGCIPFSSRVPLRQGTLTKGEGLGTVDLHVLTCIDPPLLILLNYLLFYKTSYLNEEVNRTNPSSPLVNVSCSSSITRIPLTRVHLRVFQKQFNISMWTLI
jgi:hypothetical protein